MGEVIDLPGGHHALASAGHRSGRNSPRGTPVASSIGSTNSAGTPRLERVSQYQTCDCVVPIRSAKGFCPPAFSHARFNASVDDMPDLYLDLGKNQPKTLWTTGHLNFGSHQFMKRKARPVDKAAFGARVAARRAKLGVSAKTLGESIGMSQSGIDAIEHGKVARPGMLIELAEALSTTANWLRYGEGPEEVVPPSLRERLQGILRSIPENKLPLTEKLFSQLLQKESGVA